MSKELNILQAIEMPVGTEFKVIHDNGIVNGCKAILYMDHDYKFLKWDNGQWLKLTSKNLNAKFIPIQKPVSFMEAIKARYEGKTIKVVLCNNERIYKDNSAGLKDQNGGYLTPLEILEGKWYIEEE